MEKLIPLPELSKETGVSIRVLTRAIKTKFKYKKLIASKIGLSWHVTKSDWEDFLHRKSNMN